MDRRATHRPGDRSAAQGAGFQPIERELNFSRLTREERQRSKGIFPFHGGIQCSATAPCQAILRCQLRGGPPTVSLAMRRRDRGLELIASGGACGASGATP